MTCYQNKSLSQVRTFLKMAGKLAKTQSKYFESRSSVCQIYPYMQTQFCMDFYEEMYNMSRNSCILKWKFTGFSNISIPTGSFKACFSHRKDTFFTQHFLRDEARINYETGWRILPSNIYLSTNITFTTLHVPVRSTSSCYQRNIYISPQGFQAFTYCGNIPTFSLYPAAQGEIIIGIYFVDYGFCQLEGLFSVIDKTIVHNFATSQVSLFNPVPQFVFRKNTLNFSMLINYVVVEKGYFIVVRMNDSTPIKNYIFQVFDGPSTSANKIAVVRNSFTTSSFQCIVVSSVSTEEHDTQINFHSRTVNPHKRITISKNSLHVVLLSSCLAENPFCIFVSAPTGWHVNVTIKNINFTGGNYLSYQYGGLAAVQPNENKYMEIESICHSIQQGHRKMILSSTSHLLLLVHWYKQYSSLKINLKLSRSKCHPIPIDPCVVKQKCGAVGSETECAAYLTTVCENSSVKLQPGDNEKTEVLYYVKNTQCSILQFSQSQNFLSLELGDLEACFLTLTLDENQHKEKVIHHIISGVMSNSTMSSDKAVIAGIPEMFCNYLETSASVDMCFERRFILEYNLDQPSASCRSTSLDKKVSCGPFFFSVMHTFPIFKEYFKFEQVQFSGPTASYLDIIVFVSTKPSTMQQMYITNNLQGRKQYRLKHGADAFKFPRGYVLQLETTANIKRCLTIHLSSYLSLGFKSKNFLWSSTHLHIALKFTSFKSSHHISLVGETYAARIETADRLLSSINLKATWIHDMFHRFSFFVETRPCKDISLEAARAANSRFCLNYSESIVSNQVMNNYFLFFGKNFKLIKDKVSPVKYHYVPSLKSWREASELCNSVGGYLPQFFNEEEVTQLLAFIKLSADFYPAETIYIGLVFNASTKVSNNMQILLGAFFFYERFMFDTFFLIHASYLPFQAMMWDKQILASHQLFSNVYFNKMQKIDVTLYHTDTQRRLSLSETLNLADDKTEAQHKIYPHTTDNQSCVIMMLGNPAQPDWWYIDCDKNITGDIFCSLPSKKYKKRGFVTRTKICSFLQTFFQKSCFHFVWMDTTTKPLPNRKHVQCLNRSNPFQVFFNLVNKYISPIFIKYCRTNDVRIVLTFNLLCKIHKQREINATEMKTGFHVFVGKPKQILLGSHLFKCKNELYISQLYVCDDVQDCPQKESQDEQFCECNMFDLSVHNVHLCRLTTIEGQKHCSPFYTKGKHGICDKFVTQPKAPTHISGTHKENLFDCQNNSNTVNNTLVDDLFADCGPKAEDEPVLHSLLKFGKKYPCSDKNQIPCLKGHPKCFNISDLCHFQMNKNNYLDSCRNGGHLKSCQSFECNAMFKCPTYYCVPFSYLCDGKWDCPFGDDESMMCKHVERCANMYKCRKSASCAHVANICDGTIHCPQGDDESLCELKGISCPKLCFCLALALTCIETTSLDIQGSYPFLAVSL